MMACSRPCLFCFAGVCVRVRRWTAKLIQPTGFCLASCQSLMILYVLFVVGVDHIFASFLHLAAVSFSVVVYRWTRQNHTPKIIQTNKPTKLQQIMHSVLYRCVSYGVLPHDEAKRLFKVVLDRKRHGRSAASSPSPVRKKPPKAKILKDEGLYDADFVVSGSDGIGTATL